MDNSKLATMKKSSFILILFCSLLLMAVDCCKEDDSEMQPTLQIKILNPTDIGENEFTANWSVSRTDISSIEIHVSEENDFDPISQKITVNDITKNTQVINGLRGARVYHYKLGVTLNDGSVEFSENDSIATGYQTDDADVVTVDGIQVDGKIHYLSDNPPKSPVIFLLGHATLINTWSSEELFRELLSQGYICYTLDYRGHGQSDPWPTFEIDTKAEVVEFIKVYVKNDIMACYNYAKTLDMVDTTRIGWMGGSLGANSSLLANNWPGVKFSVALTASRFGLEDVEEFQNIFIAASKNDANETYNFDYSDEADILYNVALEPKKKIIIEGNAHGIFMLGKENLYSEVLDWINARMQD